jgi:hypothetical protein
VFVLVRGLPPRETALARALHGTDAAAWGPSEYLLADTVDALNAANWQRAQGKPADYPKPYPRPGDEPDEVTRDAPERVAARAEYERRMQRPSLEERQQPTNDEED